MTHYCWYSQTESNLNASREADKNGKDIGYALIVDSKTDTLYQQTEGGKSPEPRIKWPDLKLAGVIEDDRDAWVALDWKGEVTPMGENYCKKHGLPATKESLISKTVNFIEPDPKAAQAAPAVKAAPQSKGSIFGRVFKR